MAAHYSSDQKRKKQSFTTPLQKAYLPIGCLGASFRSDAIRQSHARQHTKGISLLRLNFLVRRIGSSSRPQAGVEASALDRLAPTYCLSTSPLVGFSRALDLGPF